MFCKNCGKELTPESIACDVCGFQKGTGNRFCANCGNEFAPGAAVCGRCGCPTAGGPQVNPADQKSKMAAGLLGIFLGAYGIHNFYLGFVGKGVAQIIVSLITCGIGGLWGLIEGILILCGNINKDAKGNPLKD